jgi:hypothetical protein
MCQVEVVVGTKQESVFLVFEYCEHDLATLLDSSAKPPFTVCVFSTCSLRVLYSDLPTLLDSYVFSTCSLRVLYVFSKATWLRS